MSVKNIVKDAEKIVLLFHIDADGVCSAKIVSEALRRINKRIMDFFPTSPQLLKSKSFQTGLLRDSPDLIIMVDIGVDEDEPIIINNPDKKFLIIDHHQAPKDFSGKNIVHINPKLKGNERYIPASRLCFNEMKKVVNIDDLDWVCAAGIIGDTGGISEKRFIIKTLKKYKFKVNKDKDYFFDSFFGELAGLINAVKMRKGNDGASEALKIMERSGSPNEFYSNAYELKKYKEEVDEYLDSTVELFNRTKEHYDEIELLFFTFTPRFTIGSTLSTILSFRYPNRTIVMFTRKGATTTVNFRRHDKKYDMGRLAKNSTKGLKNAGGGGHVPAAGAQLQTKDVNLMKRNIIAELKKMMNLAS